VITKLNLASKPFRNRSLPWTIAVLVVLLSLATFIFILRATHQTNQQSALVQADINNLNLQEQELLKQAEVVQTSLSAEQLQVLGAAHELVDRKRFSWSRLLADLEAALPGQVRVTRITVRDVATRGEETLAELELTVVGKTPATVTEMIAAMDRVGVFQADLRSQNLLKGRGETGTECELYVRYRPGAGVPALAQEKDFAAIQGAVAKNPGGVK
jgi:Tfp pilus assembly protein PilN